jgi:hypothetical protein
VGVLQGRSGRADQHDLAPQALARDAREQVRKRDRREGVDPAAEVDPGAAAVERRRGQPAAADPRGGDDRDAREPGSTLGVAPDHRASIGGQVRRRRTAVDLREDVVAAQDVGAAVGLADAGGQGRAARAADGIEQREVVGGARRRLGELHVVDDLLRAGGAQAVDGARVVQAPERPATVTDGLNAVLVDGDDHDVRDRRRVAQAEARVDARVLQRRQRPAERGAARDQRGGDAGQQAPGCASGLHRDRSARSRRERALRHARWPAGGRHLHGIGSDRADLSARRAGSTPGRTARADRLAGSSWRSDATNAQPSRSGSTRR